MKSVKSKLIVLSLGALFAGFVISACNSNPPVISPKTIAGTLPTFTSTPCVGVFGNVTVCTTVDSTQGAYMYLYPYVIYTNKEFAGLSIYCTSAVPVTYEMGLYAANALGTIPTTLLGQTGLRTSGPVTGWNPAYFNSPVPLSSGVTYWMALHGSNIQYQAAPTSIYAYQGSIAFGSLPTTSAPTTFSGFVFSLYALTCP